MKKKNKIKRAVAIYLAVVLVLSAIAVVGVSAKTYTWTHTVELATMPGDTYGIGTSMGGTGRMSDTFSSYPTIFNGYSSSVNRARAYNYDEKIYYSWQNFTLFVNNGPKTITYGTTLLKGGYDVQYQNVDQGGFRSSSILSRTY